VGAIVLKGAGGRALCAGGDVRALATMPGDAAARTAAAISYFRGEDSLVYRIATLSKPHIAIMDGIVMARRRAARLSHVLRIALYATYACNACRILSVRARCVRSLLAAGRRRWAVHQRRAARGHGALRVRNA
jgi:1,4-dihydroxy-2-naphthoyl-CoA synthase